MLLTISWIIFFIILTISFTLNFIHYIHMFQLNSYSAKEQFKWMGQNVRNIVFRHVFSVLAMAEMLIFPLDKASTILCAAGFLCLNGIASTPKPAKKKLVYTPRVIRMIITSAVLYIAACVLTMVLSQDTILPAIILPLLQMLSLVWLIIANLLNKPIELSINKHYINDAKGIIKQLPNLTVVGITGSYGKTSTKFYLNKLLSAKYNVLMTPESYNTTLGVVKTVRGSLKATHEIFICEMGAKNLLEIKEICDIVHPRHGIITSIGPQHLESFKTIDNIIKTKFELADAVSDGMVFLNYDNEYIKNHKTDKNIVSYGIGNDGTKQYYADNISVSERGTTFTVHFENESQQFTTKLIGQHNVENIVGAISTAHKLGISFSELIQPVKRLECVPHRLQIVSGANSVIIDDAFNSNPSGAKAALDTLAVFDGYKVLVTPGMIELGEKEYELNKNFGRQAAEVADFCVLVGEKQAVALKEGLIEAGYSKECIFVAANLKEGLSKTEALNTGGRKKIILLENDLPDNY